ncbi:MAG: hypothetical protein AAB590_00575, partial [Patescibacteria group bacterium]
NLGSNYLSEDISQALTPEQKTALVENLSEDLTQSLPKPIIFTSSDINLIPTTSANLRTYYNALALLLARNENVPDETSIMDRALATHDLKLFSKLKPTADHYKNIASRISSLPVPSLIGESHLALSNDLSQTSYGLALMSADVSDPLKILLGFNAYRIAYTDIQRISPTLFAPIAQGLVVFEYGDAGSIFSQ